MFIVIEGTDASGKSTLVEEIKKQLAISNPHKPLDFFHKGKPEDMTRRWVLNDYVNSIQTRDFVSTNAVADRWHWGEVTYAPLKRPAYNKDGYGLLGLPGWRWTELFLASRGVAQFWLYQPLEVIKKRLESRGDDYVSSDELEKILELYRFAVGNSCNLTDVILPDADNMGEVPYLARSIITQAQNVARDALPISEFPEYIGTPRPKALLVGDTRNISKKHGEETILPFMPVDGNSGDFLLTALDNDDWKEMGIVNINEEGMRTRFTRLWTTLGEPNIICLGRLAEKGVYKAGVNENFYRVVSHPQHVRRFYYSRRDEYGQAISRIADTMDKGDPWILR